jgi:hypothetical protein
LVIVPDDESVAFNSLGAFAGEPFNDGISNDYIVSRGATGWSTTALVAPAALIPAGVAGGVANLVWERAVRASIRIGGGWGCGEELDSVH